MTEAERQAARLLDSTYEFGRIGTARLNATAEQVAAMLAQGGLLCTKAERELVEEVVVPNGGPDEWLRLLYAVRAERKQRLR